MSDDGAALLPAQWAVKSVRQDGGTLSWTIETDMDPDTLNVVGAEIYRRWVEFAMGQEALGGQTLQHPTGRYASSIGIRRRGKYTIEIEADDKFAPEARILETGHGPYDMKTKFRGRTFPMHRGKKGDYGSAGYGAPINRRDLARTARGRKKNVWAAPRAEGATGFATVPSKITAQNAGSWIIPSMPAWSPAQHIVDLIKNGAI